MKKKELMADIESNERDIKVKKEGLSSENLSPTQTGVNVCRLVCPLLAEGAESSLWPHEGEAGRSGGGGREGGCGERGE